MFFVTFFVIFAISLLYILLQSACLKCYTLSIIIVYTMLLLHSWINVYLCVVFCNRKFVFLREWCPICIMIWRLLWLSYIICIHFWQYVAPWRHSYMYIYVLDINYNVHSNSLIVIPNIHNFFLTHHEFHFIINLRFQCNLACELNKILFL